MENHDTTARRSAVRTLVINGMAVALVCVTAMLVHIRIPIAGTGGMIQLGGLPLFIFALLYGRKTGAIAGAFGLALFDLLSGWMLWAPFSLVIGGLMGYIVGLAAENNPENRIAPYALSMLAAAGITIAGYYVAEGILYGNWIAPVGSVPVNFFQVALPAAASLPIGKRLKRMIA